MKYGELFHFDPIQAIIQLRDANENDRAAALVDSYVVSEDMAERLVHVVIPQLQFVRDEDNKGVFVVGNYGSGKSHLLSVLSSVAEHAPLAQRVRHPGVAKALGDIAGRFRVLRVEIGTTAMSLRDILCGHLESFLAREGVTFSFPAVTEVSGYKRAFEDMMAAFGRKHPDKGLLVVVDELLDFLRQRDDYGVAHDLSFLREIGESCRDLRLRFMAGIQEVLFDNPRFQAVNESLRRVEARFRQIQIARDDVRFVVAARLLRKDETQRKRVREYLTRFARYYERMGERLDLFVDLFPIHPDFLDVFERLPIVEKRVALTVVSEIARDLQGATVPDDRPGVVSYDRFGESILRNPTYRTVKEIKPVVDCAMVLDERVRLGITKPNDQQTALRIIRALTVQRLAVGDNERPIGVTAAQLRDGLCLYDPDIEGLNDEDAAEDLRTSIEATLREIVRTVSGQFLSVNPDNDQWYFDLKKTEDYDANIDVRAATLGDTVRDRYWFEALKRVMECTDATLVTGFRIWEHEIEWREHHASRRGYLIFGAPNERPTAQPPRDFYLYFMQPWHPPTFRDEKRADEVFFRLVERSDAVLLKHLDIHAAASELALTSTGNARATYEKKAGDALRRVIDWMRQNLTTGFEVVHEGRKLTFGEQLKRAKITPPQGARLNVRDLVNGVASHLFAAHFHEQAPQYPTFPALITSENRNRAAAEALRVLRGVASRSGRAVLDALQLLDGDLVRPKASPYAQKVIEMLRARGAGKVVNRSELLVPRDGVEYDAHFRLEPEWFVVVLAALVHAGELTLALPGRKFDAGDLDALVATPIDDLIGFRHVEAPKGWNRALLIALFEMVGLPGGQGVSIVEGVGAAESFQNLQTRLDEVMKRVLDLQRRVHDGISFWGVVVFDDVMVEQSNARIDVLRQALDALRNLRGVGQLKNLAWDEADARARAADLAWVSDLDALYTLLAEHSAAASWITVAESALPEGHPWRADVRRERDALVALLRDPAQRTQPKTRVTLGHVLASLQEHYVAAYVPLHRDRRMGPKDAARRDALLHDRRLRQLDRLATLPLFSKGEVDRIREQLDGLVVCERLVSADLRATPVCPHCGFRPVTDSSPDARAVLPQVDVQLDKLVGAWVELLVDNLDNETARKDRAMLDGAARSALETFVERKALPEPLDEGFLEAVRTVLGGIVAVTLDPWNLALALVPDGVPATLAEMRRNFERYLSGLARNHDASRVRVLLATRRRESP